MQTRTHLRRQLTPSLVIATAALAVSLGGTAWAAATITGANVKNESLTGADLKNGSLATLDLKNGSITLPKIAPATQAALRGAPGPAGADGTDGVDGARGPAGAVSATVVRTVSDTVSDGSATSVYVGCQSGERVISGGGRTGFAADVPITQSFPATDASTPATNGGVANGWVAAASNPLGGLANFTVPVTAFVVCAS